MRGCGGAALGLKGRRFAFRDLGSRKYQRLIAIVRSAMAPCDRACKAYDLGFVDIRLLQSNEKRT